MLFKKKRKKKTLRYDFVFEFSCYPRTIRDSEILMLELIDRLPSKPMKYEMINVAPGSGFALTYRRTFASRLEALKFSKKHMKTILSYCKKEGSISPFSQSRMWES